MQVETIDVIVRLIGSGNPREFCLSLPRDVTMAEVKNSLLLLEPAEAESQDILRSRFIHGGGFVEDFVSVGSLAPQNVDRIVLFMVCLSGSREPAGRATGPASAPDTQARRHPVEAAENPRNMPAGAAPGRRALQRHLLPALSSGLFSFLGIFFRVFVFFLLVLREPMSRTWPLVLTISMLLFFRSAIAAFLNHLTGRLAVARPRLDPAAVAPGTTESVCWKTLALEFFRTLLPGATV